MSSPVAVVLTICIPIMQLFGLLRRDLAWRGCAPSRLAPNRGVLASVRRLRERRAPNATLRAPGQVRCGPRATVADSYLRFGWPAASPPESQVVFSSRAGPFRKRGPVRSRRRRASGPPRLPSATLEPAGSRGPSPLISCRWSDVRPPLVEQLKPPLPPILVTGATITRGASASSPAG